MVAKKKASMLKDVASDKRFWVSDGSIIKNLRELEPAIDRMSIEVFKSHVNDEKNDFSAWVETVIKDEELAKQLMGTKDKIMTQLLIVKRLLKLKNG